MTCKSNTLPQAPRPTTRLVVTRQRSPITYRVQAPTPLVLRENATWLPQDETPRDTVPLCTAPPNHQ